MVERTIQRSYNLTHKAVQEGKYDFCGGDEKLGSWIFSTELIKE